jgi:hypothetical protein
MLATFLFRIFVFSLLYKNLKIKIYKIIILPIVLCGSGTWSLTREEHSLRVSENRVPRRIFGPKKKKKKVMGGAEDCIMRSFITYMLHQILLG